MGSGGNENGGSRGWARGSLGGSTRVALGVQILLEMMTRKLRRFG